MTLLGLILASVLEVRVKADVGWKTLDKPLESPEGCVAAKATSRCLIGTYPQRMFRYEGPSCTLSLAEKTVVEVVNSEKFRLVRGRLLADCEASAVVELPQADIRMDRGIFLLDYVGAEFRNPTPAVLRVLDGTTLVEPRGGEKSVAVASGLQVSLGRVGAGGVLQVSPPQGFILADTLQVWANLMGLDRHHLNRMARQKLGDWRLHLEQASEAHQQVVERKLASLREESEVLQKQVEKRREERRQIQRLIWKRLSE